METTDLSDESELELPRSMIKENKKRLSTKKCLKQTITKVCNKLEDEHERCSARKASSKSDWSSDDERAMVSRAKKGKKKEKKRKN